MFFDLNINHYHTFFMRYSKPFPPGILSKKEYLSILKFGSLLSVFNYSSLNNLGSSSSRGLFIGYKSSNSLNFICFL